MTMLGIALAAGLLAQASSGQPAAAPAADKVTVTGCVERADQVTPTGSSLGTTVDSLDFVLMKAKEGTSDAAASGTGGASATGTAGSTATGAAAAPASGPLYRLDAKVGELNPHVGHKVEIVGTVEGGAGRLANSGANARTLKVDSIKMIASTCAR